MQRVCYLALSAVGPCADQAQLPLAAVQAVAVFLPCDTWLAGAASPLKRACSCFALRHALACAPPPRMQVQGLA